MEGYSQIQCLIFYLEEDSTCSGNNSDGYPSFSNGNASSYVAKSKSEVKTYLLLPEVFKLKRPEFLNFFVQKGLQFIDEESHSILADTKLRILEIRLDGSTDASLNPLNIAHTHECGGLVKHLFKNIRIQTSELVYENRRGAILPAVDDGNLKIIEPYVKRDIPCEFGLCFKGNLLHIAATAGPSAFVTSLLDRGFDIDQRESSAAEFTPLHLAIIGGAPLAVVSLLVERGADVDAQERKDGKTPLLLTKNLELAEMLLENGADVNCRSSNDETPLLIALAEQRGNQFKRVKLFLKYGASVDIQYKNGSLSAFAQLHSSADVFQYLLETSYTDRGFLFKSVFWNFDILDIDWFGQSNINRSKVAHHVVKINTANHKPIFDNDEMWLIYLWCREHTLRNQCEIEVEKMKSVKLGNTDVLLYDVLGKNENEMTCLLRNDYVAELADREFLPTDFPQYGNILKSVFEKGIFRKKMLEEGMKLFNFLFRDFLTDVPDEIIERIVRLYLSNRDIIILRTCVNSAGQTRSH